MPQSTDRLPPHSVEAEQSVLGALMLSTQVWEKIADRVNESDFYRRDHQIIFRAIADLSEKNTPSDIITVEDWLSQRDLLVLAGGSRYLATLANQTPGYSNVVSYAEIVREKSILRQLIDTGTEIIDDCIDSNGQTSHEILELAEQRIFRIAETGVRQRMGFQNMRAAVKDAFSILQTRYENRGSVTGISTGFEELDTLTAGLQPQDLIIIAARPSMGKSSLAVGIAQYASVKYMKTAAIFSMEMSASQIAFRLISSTGQIDQQDLRTGEIKDEDWPKVTKAISELSTSKIFIDDTPALSPTELRARARRIKRDQGLDLIVVDYLQLMTVPGSKENRATEISEISRGLKALAKELHVPVIALSQLNRAVEQRSDKRPVMADLRESGAIEQDADVIAFIYRDDYYNKQSIEPGIAEIIIAKQRNGPTGTIKLRFLGKYTHFEDPVKNLTGTFE